MMNGNTIKLSDGRNLGYSEYGSSKGEVLFYFHGHPGSRLEARFLAEPATRVGIRLVGVDRPGIGLSTYKKNRHILDWPDDVIELADALHIERFAVIGFSGGGPYALACSYKIPERLTACGVVSGVGRISPFLSFLSMWLPWLVLPITRGFFRNQEQAEKTLKRFAQRWIKSDRSALDVGDTIKTMAASLVEGLRQGTKGAARDGMLLGNSNWGFRPRDITFPKLYLWHGELDNQVPVSTVQAMVGELPNCETLYYPDEGHISTIVNNGEIIVETLFNRVPARTSEVR